MKKNYVNNAALVAALTVYRQECEEARKAQQELPQIPDYVAQCIMAIAAKLANRRNFLGNVHRDEMVGEAILQCVEAVRNFDPSKSNNAFSFFTTVAWNAFLWVIRREEKQLYIRLKASENMAVFDCEDEVERAMFEPNEFAVKFVADFEADMKRRNAK